VYTASGAVLALHATLAIGVGDIRRAFGWLLTAVVIDSTDGWLARRARVAERTPSVDGTKLDDLVDYLTFVFVPVLLMWRADLLPAAWGLVPASAVLVASGVGFAHHDAKTADHFFTGFPSYWNVVALYLCVFGWPPALNGFVLLVLSGLVFVRIGYVYPTRTAVLRELTMGLSVVWAATLVGIIVMLPAPPAWLVAFSLFYPLYYGGLSLVLHGMRGGREHR
jgi:phosphatidylcholine synthase